MAVDLPDNAIITENPFRVIYPGQDRFTGRYSGKTHVYGTDAAYFQGRAVIEAQDGDPSVVEQPGRLPGAVHTRTLRADRGGWITAIDARKIGLAAMQLGAGRRTADDSIDHGAGITLSAKTGGEVRKGDVLAVLHFNDPPAAGGAAALAGGAYRIGGRPPRPQPLILEEIG